MAEIRPLSDIRDKWTPGVTGRDAAENRSPHKIINGNESPFHIPPLILKPVNLHPLIRRFQRITKLQKQAIDLLKQEIEELKSL
ncbi:hypothetical protein ES707_20741 [subsurface metagenome]